MSSQAYTNRVRILAEASLTKIQYPGRIAIDNRLSASVNCSRNFDPIVYTDICRRCIVPPSLDVMIPRYLGGNALTQSNVIFDGGNSATNSSRILSGS
jgi:hypothetical protein